MDTLNVSTVKNVILNRRGYSITGTLILSPYHLVFSFLPPQSSTSTSSSSSNSSSTSTLIQPKEIWICYPVIERLSKSRGSSWISNASITNNLSNNGSGDSEDIEKSESVLPKLNIPDFDHYTASHIRLQCKDFTFYSFDFLNDLVCTEVFSKLSFLITVPKIENDIQTLYAYDYQPNTLEKKLLINGWNIYDPIQEYKRLGLLSDDDKYWRASKINHEYKFCPSYPNILIVPSTISDNVLKHTAKFRSKQRIPAVVYKHRNGINGNGNVIARCSQPLVGLNLQNRSIQDEKLIAEIFNSQEKERKNVISEDRELQSQPQKNLLVDLRPLTNAMAQHALGAGTENIENYRGKSPNSDNNGGDSSTNGSIDGEQRQVNKIFCNIDNIHVMRDSLNKLTSILNDLDKFPVSNSANKTQSSYPLLQQSLTKTMWLHRISIILQSVDRITKSIHFNNTNVIIHCSDGWDRTSQVSALSQLCLDPYYRTIKGFMVLIEKEWVSFGFKFSTRGDHGGCIGAILKKEPKQSRIDPNETSSEPVPATSSTTSSSEPNLNLNSGGGYGSTVASFLQRAATHIKNTAANSPLLSDSDLSDSSKYPGSSIYTGSNEKSPVFHQFLDCVYQIYRQHPSKFEFNSRFLKRLFYHYYSCQYGSFLCDSERELRHIRKVQDKTVSVWDYFNSRPKEFSNSQYLIQTETEGDGEIFFNFADVKWWYELYGRSDEEMNGLSNSLDRKFAQMKLNRAASPANSTTNGTTINGS
ncbi:myotubularin-related dual specificity phosphatase [Scheffersomyces amazonensis]|uniref:myotubularin-related dual specificity phosphatase n=1 Tax=Scheffersomyces amazonensis TaxID=1078765 RepID=UPI00315C5E18